MEENNVDSKGSLRQVARAIGYPARTEPPHFLPDDVGAWPPFFFMSLAPGFCPASLRSRAKPSLASLSQLLFFFIILDPEAKTGIFEFSFSQLSTLAIDLWALGRLSICWSTSGVSLALPSPRGGRLDRPGRIPCSSPSWYPCVSLSPLERGRVSALILKLGFDR